jgi:hypothetical protein
LVGEKIVSNREIIISILRKHFISRKISEEIANEILVGKKTKTAVVTSRHWGPDDDYLVVETQVFAEEGFRAGQQVEMTLCAKETNKEVK